MSFLLINLVVLAVVAAAAVLAYAQMRQSWAVDEWMAPAPGVDYGALQAHWRGLAPAQDWATLRAQVGRWREPGLPEAGATHCDEVAHYLNRAVFRFAVPGDALTLGRTASGAHASPGAAYCPARLRARART